MSSHTHAPQETFLVTLSRTMFTFSDWDIGAATVQHYIVGCAATDTYNIIYMSSEACVMQCHGSFSFRNTFTA